MKILIIADNVVPALWGTWSEYRENQLKDVELILSAGDLPKDYLEFLVTMINVPLLYVPGNHDTTYDERPPEGCVNIDGEVCEVPGVRVYGLGGSMRYKPGTNMYSESEMARRVALLELKLQLGTVIGLDSRRRYFQSGKINSGSKVTEIFLSHAPCRGHGDMDDLAHTGFECFNGLLNRHRPDYHCYGHVHMEYGMFRRESVHPSGTTLINTSGMYMLEI